MWIAPVGCSRALCGRRARGRRRVGALLHYVLIVMGVGIFPLLAAYPLAMFGARIPLGRFARAIAPAQAVAFSTQSSVASLPAMLKSAERLDVPVAAAGVTLPMAVAVFRATGPAMNLAVAIYIAYWFGIEITWPMLAVGVAAAATTTMGSPGIPGQASFVTASRAARMGYLPSRSPCDRGGVLPKSCGRRNARPISRQRTAARGQLYGAEGIPAGPLLGEVIAYRCGERPTCGTDTSWARVSLGPNGPGGRIASAGLVQALHLKRAQPHPPRRLVNWGSVGVSPARNFKRCAGRTAADEQVARCAGRVGELGFPTIACQRSNAGAYRFACVNE